MTVELWRHERLPEITLAHSAYSDHEFQPHFHDHYVIMIVDEGVNEGICEKKKFQVTTNDVLFINPGEIHTGSSWQSKHLRYSALYVGVDFFTRDFPAGNNAAPPEFTTLRDKNSGLALRIKDLLHSSKTSTSSFEIDEKKVRAFGEMIGYANLKEEKASVDILRSSVQKIKTFIKDQYNNQFTLASLAEYTGLSQYHLIRSFKNSVGITPFQFLRNYRIEKAKLELLKDKSITEVALEVGFYDQSHFHKHFRLVTGITPGEFKRQ